MHIQELVRILSAVEEASQKIRTKKKKLCSQSIEYGTVQSAERVLKFNHQSERQGL